jgi:hypothetical protein
VSVRSNTKELNKRQLREYNQFSAVIIYVSISVIFVALIKLCTRIQQEELLMWGRVSRRVAVCGDGGAWNLFLEP